MDLAGPFVAEVDRSVPVVTSGVALRAFLPRAFERLPSGAARLPHTGLVLNEANRLYSALLSCGPPPAIDLDDARRANASRPARTSCSALM
ncbi:hypothetical protein [Nonomuraea sp. NPDC003709]|uniref:hypothetical protein n=1 Tax=Nonomuraea sp. NPDC003709 TaxID=3154450 RepID=UPI0033A108C0